MIVFGRDLTADFAAACRREWLVTDGLGGWASGTVSGANTRRYHGLFVPALAPPLGRTVLVTKFNEWVTVGQERYPLSSNEYADGTIDPWGFRHLEDFRLEDGLPVWTYAFGETQIQKRVWLAQGEPVAHVAYVCHRGSRPVTLEVIPMVTARDAHGETAGAGWMPQVQPVKDGAWVRAGAYEFWIRANRGAYDSAGVWHLGIKHRAETERGLGDREDQFAAGTFTIPLAPPDSRAVGGRPGAVFAMTLDDRPAPRWPLARSRASRQPPGSKDRTFHALSAPERARVASRTSSPEGKAVLESEPEWIRQLTQAAAQFLVRRGNGTTIIAGYHWFGDWGRDTMIALPGLCLATRRFAEAASILKTWAGFVNAGLLPNRFPDQGTSPEYNSADATLWYLHAIDRYVEATKDLTLAGALWPVLEDIIGWHQAGTRHGIHMDPADGLLHAGEPGVALTWMDAKVGDWVVTPRMGKPVEINALWVNALRVMHGLASRLRVTPAHDYLGLAEGAVAAFDRYWNPDANALFDVIDGPDGQDPAIRPNQLFAVSLPHAPIGPDHPRAEAVVDLCAQHLLTSYGLRSLSPRDPAYIGTYAGHWTARDGAYHQGTVWGWLIGPFVEAHYRVRRDAGLARSFLEPFEQHLADAGLGTIGEIFDGDAPHTPRGCIAQAWSVAEVLRVWHMLRDDGQGASKKAKGKRKE